MRGLRNIVRGHWLLLSSVRKWLTYVTCILLESRGASFYVLLGCEMKLRRNEICPLHGRRDCCGRESIVERRKPRNVTKHGVTTIPDEHHPRGYRERRSPAAMRELLAKKVAWQNGLCGICLKPMDDYREIVPDHIEPRGMGGARRDDHPDNIQAAHSQCNLEKGSRRI